MDSLVKNAKCCLYKYDNGYNPMSGCLNANQNGICPKYNERYENSPRMEETTYDRCINEHPYDERFQWNGNSCNAHEN